MDIDKTIELCLKELKIYGFLEIDDFINDNFNNDFDKFDIDVFIDHAIDKMICFDLIKLRQNSKNIYEITRFGLFIANNNGYLDLLIIDKFKSDREADKKEIEFKKLKFDFKLSKWQRYTFWPVMICGLISFGFTVYNLFKDNKKEKLNEMQLIKVQQSFQDSQKELSTLRTLVLDQKHRNSLYNSTHPVIQDYKKTK